MTTFCATCGKEILRKPSDVLGKGNIFCSRECHYKFGEEEVECLNCNKTFIAKKTAHRKFCSVKCRQEYLPNHQETNRETLTCKNCGKSFVAVKSAQRQFCGVNCFEYYQKNRATYTNAKMRSYTRGKESFYSKWTLWNPNIEILGEYKAMRQKILCKCKQHLEVFEMNPVDILKGIISCSQCNYSIGENLISSFLDEYNIEYVRQATFNECRYINPLHFDFYLEKENMVIEYDGEQHFKPVIFGCISEEDVKKEYIKTQNRDQIKNNYCQEKRNYNVKNSLLQKERH